MKEVSGISLKELEEPIRTALKRYEKGTDERLKFDIDSAAQLELTPDKPNSARSSTDVSYLGKLAGKLFVIAFKPSDGSGDESGYKLEDLDVEPGYPRSTKVVPRNKKGIHSEGHLAIVRHKIDTPNSEPELFAGAYDLLGLDGKTIRKIGELGYEANVSVEDMTPLTTLTVGYHPKTDGSSERFGDPHAVFSSVPDALQVCAFLAITDEMYQQHPGLLTSLNPREPRHP